MIHRNNRAGCKKTVLKFRSKKPKHRGTGKRVEAAKFHITNQHLGLTEPHCITMTKLLIVNIMFHYMRITTWCYLLKKS